MRAARKHQEGKELGVKLNRDSAWWARLMVVILLLAFALRAVQLERQPLWWDEGNNVYFAHQNLLELFDEARITNDADPPAHRLALGVWQTFVGSSAFAARLFSVFLGLTAVVLTWAMGCWLTGKRTALLASLLVALSPMQIHYTREAKGYPFALVCALLSTYAWGRRLGYSSYRTSLRGKPTWWWITYVVSTAAAVGTHYYLGLLVLWQGLWVVARAVQALVRQNPACHEALTRLGQWSLAAGVVALVLAPWALPLFGSTVQGVMGLSAWQGDALSLWSYLGQVSGEFGAGMGEGRVALTASCGMALLGLVGALAGRRRAFLLTWVTVPLVVAYFMQTFYSFFFPRFLLYLGPPCYLLVSRGIATLRRRLSVAAGVISVIAVIGLWIPGLMHVYAEPVDEAEDPRPAVSHVCALARPGDAVVYGYLWQAGYLLSYCPQTEFGLYRSYFSPQTVGPELTLILTSHARIWLLDYEIAAENLHNLSSSWLRAEAYEVESSWYGNHHLALYLAPRFRRPGVGPDEGVNCFDGRIELHYPLVDAYLSPGDTLALPLRWKALAALDEDYVVFVHLGMPGVPPLAQNDGPPRNGLNPTSTWTVGQEVVDRRALLLPDTIPPGRYQVMVGLYRSPDGSRLPIDDTPGQDALIMGYVDVER
jgi:4-amino-4-deoxy-L-arabinose transferase-like glycosyltransferase